MKVIGITGGVGSGKTALLNYIREQYNCRILLSDEASHEVMLPGGAAYEELVKLLSAYPADPAMEQSGSPQPDSRTAEEDGYHAGTPAGRKGDKALLNADGTISHREMAARIFAHQDLLEKVNAVLHPAVRVYILDAIREEQEKNRMHAPEAVDYFFLEAALLIENGYGAVVDEMWYIYCDRDVRVQRLKAGRGYSDEKIAGIMAAQLSDEEFRRGSDVVIDNSGSLEDACRQIDAAMARLQNSSGKV